MPAIAKICGLSTPETVRAALDGGAGYLGFVFFEASPRHVTPEAAARLAAPARAKGVKVAFITGRDTASLPERFSGAEVLAKPFEFTSIQAFLGRLVGATPARSTSP